MVVHSDKLRWLFWLRWKMFLRGFTRASGRVSRIIGTIFLVLFGLPLMLAIAAGSFMAYRFLPPPMNMEVLYLVLAGAFVLWLVLPLLEFTVNEGLDLSKLALFPLTRAELMLSLLFSTLLDIPTFALLLVLIAVVAGWSLSLPLGLLAFLVVVVFYAQVVSASQLVLALLMRTLQSRRFRDLSILLIAIFSSSCYLIQQVVFRSVGSSNVVGALQSGAFSSVLQWLPPGFAARSIQEALRGNWGLSLLFLGALLATSLITLYLWQLVVERGLTSSESDGTKQVRQRRVQAEGSAVPTSIWARFVPPQVRAIVVKDLKYYRRDPQLQAAVVQSIISVVVLVAVLFFNIMGRSTNSVFVLGPWTIMFAPFFLFLPIYTLSYNVLGVERQSLTTLFLFPVEPKYILWAKNILVFIFGFAAMVVLVLAIAGFTQAWGLVLPALTAGLAGALTILGCGNFTSVFFPQRMRQSRREMQTTANLSSEAGCLRAIFSMLSFLAMIIILLPVAAALLLPIIFTIRWVWSLSIPASLAYAVAFYYVVTSLVAPRMLDKTPEILAATTRE